MHPPPMGAPAAVPSPGPPRTAVSCAAAESGGSARGVACMAIELEDGKAPERIQLFPKGPELETVNYDSRRWRMSDPQAVAAASMEDGLDLPIDWEHARARKAEKGERIPTAGWIKEIAVRDGALMGRVEWTAEGRASIESREYRYFSPYFLAFEETGEVARVRHGALVNTPAFVMPALASAQEERPMKKVLAALGLAADATDEQAAAAAETLKSERDGAQAQAAAPSLEQFVPRADYDAATARAASAEADLATLRGANADAEIKQLLDEAQAAGKIVPATRKFHEDSCRAEGGIERFKKTFAPSAPVIASPTNLGGSPPGTGGSAAGAEEKRVAALFGHTPEFVREHASPLPGGDS